MKSVESWIVSICSLGEGWHNYHHAFPWDYRAAEFGTRYSVTTFIINLLAKGGFAYDLKTTDPKLIARRIMRTGDGSHPDQETIVSQSISDKVEELDEDDMQPEELEHLLDGECPPGSMEKISKSLKKLYPESEVQRIRG